MLTTSIFLIVFAILVAVCIYWYGPVVRPVWLLQALCALCGSLGAMYMLCRETVFVLTGVGLLICMLIIDILTPFLWKHAAEACWVIAVCLTFSSVPILILGDFSHLGIIASATPFVVGIGLAVIVAWKTSRPRNFSMSSTRVPHGASMA